MVLRAALPATGALASVVGSCSRNDSPRSAAPQPPPLAPQPPASSRWEEEEGMLPVGWCTVTLGWPGVWHTPGTVMPAPLRWRQEGCKHSRPPERHRKTLAQDPEGKEDREQRTETQETKEVRAVGLAFLWRVKNACIAPTLIYQSGWKALAP